MMKKILVLCTALTLLSFPMFSSTTTASDYGITKPYYVNTEKAPVTAKSILESMYSRHDQVKRINWYYSEKNIFPHKNAFLWYVGEKDSTVWMRAKIVNFSSYSTSWIFWTKVTFSTAEKNWVYNIPNAFAGSGGDKRTEVIDGGKLETLDTPFVNVLEGYKTLANGTNPIIRLEGNQYYYDYKLTALDVENVKKALKLYELLQANNFKI